MTIKFEVAKGYEGKDINLPKRSTKFSAGYDFEVAEDVIIPAYNPKQEDLRREYDGDGYKPIISVGTYVHTGVKAKMPENMFLSLYARSSLYNKKGLIFANAVGIIDSDYYGNPKNDGEILFNLINLGRDDIILKKGERIGQGIFTQFHITDDDNAEGERVGGLGSTGGHN